MNSFYDLQFHYAIEKLELLVQSKRQKESASEIQKKISAVVEFFEKVKYHRVM